MTADAAARHNTAEGGRQAGPSGIAERALLSVINLPWQLFFEVSTGAATRALLPPALLPAPSGKESDAGSSSTVVQNNNF